MYKRQVQDVAGISNCYSTTTQWDEASPDLQEHAYEMGWYPRELPFNFAQAYSAMSLSLIHILPPEENN